MSQAEADARRWILIVHPDVEWRDRFVGLLPDSGAEAVGGWDQVSTAAPERLPDLIVVPAADLPGVLSFIQDRHGAVAIALVGTLSDPETVDRLVSAAATGQLFHALDDRLTDDELRRALAPLVHLRATPRVVSPDGFTVEFLLQEAAYSCPLLDVSSHGCAVRLSADAPLHAFLAGQVVRQLAIERCGDSVMTMASAVIRSCERISDDPGHFRVGLEFAGADRGRERTAGSPIAGALRVAAILRRAKRGGANLMLHDIGQHGRAAMTRIVELDLAAGRVELSRENGGQPALNPHDVVELTAELGGLAFDGHASVVSGDDRAVILAIPRLLWRRHRRGLMRFRPPEGWPFAVSVSSPLTGRQIIRPVVDLQPWGLSFAYDAQSEVLPVGLKLDAMELQIPSGERVRCTGVVRGIAPIPEEVPGLRQPYRCGVELRDSPEVARCAVVEAFIAERCPSAVDSTSVPFENIWRLVAEAGSTFPDYPAAPGPHMEVLEGVHHTLASAEHGLARSLVYRDEEGELQGHAAGLRVFSRTWFAQHLATRTAAKRRAAVARELTTCIIEYVEACDDIDYVRCVWREGNVWVHRMTALLTRGIGNDALSLLRRLQYLRLPRDARWSAGSHQVSVHQVRGDECAAVAHALRGRCHIGRVQAEDLSAEELELGSLSRRYAASGLERRRDLFAAYGEGDAPIACALYQATTPGLSWPEVTNAFSLEVLDPNAPQLDEACHALIARCVRHSRERGQAAAIALVDDEHAPRLAAAGFEGYGRIYEWTFHRRAVRMWHNIIWATIESHASPRTSR